MKKILSFTPSKILLFCGMGLMMTLGGFWHYQTNQVQLERMNVLNQGVATCFNRISQTFTAMMIKDIKSPYLNQAFMSLSDECLNETIKGMNPFKADAGKGYDVLNKLISEVHWFHEKVIKIHAPMLAGKDLNPPMSTLSDRFSKMENYKITLLDEVDMANDQIRQVQANDEFLMGAGLIMFVLSLSALALKEFGRVQNQIKIEKEAINLLKAGQANVGAMVDRLVERSLTSQGFPVTAQIFKDYHESLLERSNARIVSTDETKNEPEEEVEEDNYEVSAPVNGPKSSLKEVVVSLQSIHSKELINISDVRDVSLAIAFESFEQMMNAAVTLFSSHRQDTHKKIMISNQIHSDRTVINMFLANSTFTAAELEANQNDKAGMAHITDVNLMIMKEMAAETGTNFSFENKTDRQGKIAGMTLKFVINRAAREQKLKNLISVVKGKKKDLARQLVN